MNVSRGVFNIEMTIRKQFSRFRRPLQVSRSEWPLISATRPLFYFIRLFGLAPFKLSGDHFKASNYNVIYSLFWTVVQTYFAYLVLDRFMGIRRGSRMLDMTETAKVIFNYLVAMFNILIAVWTRKEFIGVLNIIKYFDTRICDLGYPRKERATKICSWSTCVFTTFLWITVSRMSIAAFFEPWFNNVTYLMNYMATSLSTIKFSGVVLMLGQRFRHLNKVAQHSKEFAMTKHSHLGIELKVIKELHNSLMNASESLNSQYEWPLLLWLLNLSVHSISNVYFLISWLLIAPPKWVEVQSAFIACIISWLIVFLGQLLLLHVACHLTSSEVIVALLFYLPPFAANRIGSILCNWKSLANSPNYSVESALHFIHRRLDFSAAGCFDINLPLLSSISTLLTTYLVLLLQFGRRQRSPCKCEEV